jgi:energy-coupling factor transporter ATP-binding protein EcfA2
MLRAVSVYNLLHKKYRLLPFTGAWLDAFARPEASGTWFVYGPSGSGKSRFAQRLAGYLDAELGRHVAYMSLEEGDRYTFQCAVRASGWREKGGRIRVLPAGSAKELDEWLGKNGKTNVVVIDTVQYWVRHYGLKAEDYFALKKKYGGKLFVYLSHVQGNEPDGAAAEHIMRDADLKIYVQGYRAFSKGRFTGEKGYFSLWPEKEAELYLNGR